jgi:hypothetical protein
MPFFMEAKKPIRLSNSEAFQTNGYHLTLLARSKIMYYFRAVVN